MLTPNHQKIPKINNIDKAKNYITFSPNSKDSNYSPYIKDKSLTNYFKSKNRNNNKIVNNNYMNLYNSNAFKTYNILSNSKDNNLNINEKTNKNKRNKIKNLLLTSLFNLPYMNSKQHNLSVKNKTKYEKIFDISKLHQNSFHNNNEIRNKTEENEGIKLENYMRDKFYEDIDKKMTIKLKSKNFLHDSSMKDKIIKMNKIGLFWGSVFEYCNPLLSVKKLKFAKKHIFNLHKNKILKDDNKYIDEYNNRINKEIKPILYTNTLFRNLRRKERIKNEIIFNKYNNLSVNK